MPYINTIEFWFFPLSGGKEIIHRFRNSFRNASTTTAPASATHISHMTLPRASATSFSKFLLPRPQPHYVFQRFWLWLVSFPFILALGPSFAFILALGPSFAFHFGLLSLHFLLFYPFGPSLPFILACFSSFALGLDTFWGHRQGVPLFGHMFLPPCFREASARLPQNTEAKRVSAEIGVFHL